MLDENKTDGADISRYMSAFQTGKSLNELKFYNFSRFLLAVSFRKFFIEKCSISMDAFHMNTMCAKIYFVQRMESKSNYIYVQT